MLSSRQSLCSTAQEVKNDQWLFEYDDRSCGHSDGCVMMHSRSFDHPAVLAWIIVSSCVVKIENRIDHCTGFLHRIVSKRLFWFDQEMFE